MLIFSQTIKSFNKYFICLLIFIPSIFIAQPEILSQLKELKPSESYIFSSWNSSSGLPQNSINKIDQDSKGFFWLATYGGLVRFDGVNFNIYSSKQYPVLGSDRITYLRVDREDKVWISTDLGKLVVFDGKKFHDLTESVPSKNQFLACLIVDSLNNKYIRGDNKILTYSGDEFHQLYLSDKEPEKGENHFFPFMMNYNDSIIISADYKNILVYDMKIIRVQKIDDEPQLYMHHNDEGIWFADKGKLKYATCFDNIPSAVTLFEEYDFARIYGNANELLGRLTDNRIVIIRNGRLRVVAEKDVIPLSRFPQIFSDNANEWWIGTEVDGLYHIRKRFLYTLDKDFGDRELNTYPIYRTRDGTIWTGQNIGLSSISRDGIQNYAGNEIHSTPVWGITSDQKDQIWFATNGNGIFRFDGIKFHRHLEEFYGKTSLNFLSAYTDNKERIWFGSVNAITCLENNEFKFFYPLGHKNNFYNFFLEDKSGRLWIASTTGLLFYEGNTFTYVPEAEAERARALYLDSRDRLWVGTYGNGLRVKVNEKYFKITSSNGLFSNIISAITEDFLGNFWFTTNNGIFRVSESDLNAFLTGKTSKINSVSYGPESGLKNVEFNGGCQPSWMRDEDGNLWFPSFNGPVIIDISSLPKDQGPPVVYVENLFTADSIYSANDKIILPPEHPTFRISFTAPTFSTIDDMDFKYRLKEIGPEWIEIGKSREVRFTKLPYGDYTFEVLARNSSGRTSLKAAAIKFSVEAKFIETGWFYILLFAFSLSVIILFFRSKFILIKRREETLRAMVDERTSSLRAAKEQAERAVQEEKLLRSKAEEADRQKLEILRIVSHDLKNPAFAVDGFATALLEDGELNAEDKEMVTYISEAAERMYELISQILTYSRLEGNYISCEKESFDIVKEARKIVLSFNRTAIKKQQNLVFECPDQQEINAITDRTLFDEILENLISNAIKYSPICKEIKVKITILPDKVSLIVKDSGPGFSEDDKQKIFKPFTKLSAVPTAGEASSGLGLSIVKNYVEILNADLILRSKLGEGSEFELIIPLEIPDPTS
ncbi:MAG: hypothetical protein K9I71_01945 [Ignavibacteriales bacterium]|nr:hypothetical protein [Ignavibacteriales bacterium]MCF8314851.1 hypothetical protein [Ignavibacteriales bacterium]MCF8436200.1 hypothetical protein [Ignavibacteriales bacterium]